MNAPSITAYLAPRLSRADLLRAVLLSLTALFALFLLYSYDWRQAGLALVGVAIGVVFQRSQFGFASTWRALIVRGDARGLRAQLLWVALAAMPFALLTGASDAIEAQAVANVRPLTMAIAIGAFLFGIGMQLGGACTSGSIVGAGGGNGVPMLSIVGFVSGALFAASQIEYWNALPAYDSFSFYHEWGVFGALAMIALAALTVAVVHFATRRLGFAASAVVSGDTPPDRMPLHRAAVFLAVLSVLLLVIGGQPWGITNGFTIAGGKTLLAAGYDDVLFWDYWARLGGEEVLEAGWFAGTQLVTTAGMLLGVAVAAAAKLALPWRGASAKRLLLAVVGGIIMGYGAQISYGCNIGSFISALSSGSAHGWLWLLFAFVGTAVGVGVRTLVRLPN